MQLHYNKFHSIKVSLLRIWQGLTFILAGLLQVVSLGFFLMSDVATAIAIINAYISDEPIENETEDI